MKILFFTPLSPGYETGGISTYIRELCRQLEQYSISFKSLGIIADPDLKIKLHLKNISALPFGTPGIRLFAAYLLHSLFYREKDILHAHRPDYLFWYCLFKKPNKMIVTIHGNPRQMISMKKPFFCSLYNRIEKFVLSHIDRIIFIDSVTHKEYLASYPFIKGKSIIIPPGVDTRLFQPMDKAHVREKYGFRKNDEIMLYIGRIEKEKRVGYILKAFKKVRKQRPRLKLILVGDGRESAILAPYSNKKDIRWYKQIAHNSLPPLINCADVLVLASLVEGFPQVILESMACGVPVVATDAGDISKAVIDGKTGYIEEVFSLDRGITKVLASGKEFEHDCILAAMRYDWKNIGKKVMRIYYDIYH